MSYFNTRLTHASAATQMTPSMQFDLARSHLNDNQLETITGSFGGIPGQWGWGFAGMLDKLLTNQPKAVPVNDLTALEGKLQQQGYLPPTYVANGQWNPTLYSGYRRFDRDNTNLQFSGNSFGSVTGMKALAAIGWTLPSSVFQGILGMAKGLLASGTTTLQRGGALSGAVGGAAVAGGLSAAGIIGGAAAGAEAGAELGSVVPGLGTLIGAGAGALVGFLAAFTHHTPEQVGQSGWTHFLDSLTPYDEYRRPGGFKAFMSDLTTIATVAGSVAGIGGGIMSAAEGIGGVSAAAGASGDSFLTQALTQTGTGDPGWFAQIAGAATKRVAGVDARQSMLDWVAEHGLGAQETRPLLGKIVNPLYSGFSESQFLARAIGNLGQGKTPSVLAADIAAAPKPFSNIDIPIPGLKNIPVVGQFIGHLGNPLDLAGFVIQPLHFFPMRAADVVRGVDAMLGEGSMAPLVHVFQTLHPELSTQQALEAGKAWLGRDPAEQSQNWVWWHQNFGTDTAAARRVLDKGLSRDAATAPGLFDDARREIIAEMKAASGGTFEGVQTAAARSLKAAQTKTTTGNTVMDDVMSTAFASSLDSTRTPWALADYILKKTGGDPQAYFDANRITNDATMAYRAGTLEGVKISAQYHPQNILQQASMQNEIDQLDKFARQLETQAGLAGHSPEEDIANLVKSKEARQRQAELITQMAEMKKAGAFKSKHAVGDLAIVPFREDTPMRMDYVALAKKDDELRTRVKNTFGEDMKVAHDAARQEYGTFLDDLVERRIITGPMADKAKVASPTANTSRRLKEISKTAPDEVKLGGAAQGALAEKGYKAGVVGRDNHVMSPDPRIGEIVGLGDFTRRRAFWETLGLGLHQVPEEVLQSLRQTQLRTEITQFARENNLPVSADSILRRIYAAREAHNANGVVTNDSIRAHLGLEPRAPLPEDQQVSKFGNLIVAHTPGGKLKVRLPAMDMRDLSRDDIAAAVSDLPTITDKHVEGIYGAIRRGAAYGSEMQFRDPFGAARAIGRALRVEGLPGFSDVMRTWHIDPDRQATRILAGVAGGAIIGAVTGDNKIKDAIEGAGLGGAAALGFNRLAHRNFGYMPDSLVKLNAALRFSLSPAFDFRRWSKQSLLAASSYDLPMFGRSDRYIAGRPFASVFHDGEITGAETWNEAKTVTSAALSGASGSARDAAKIGAAHDLAHQFGVLFDTTDDLERVLTAAGITGFNPMNRQIAHGYLLAQQGKSLPEIRAALKHLYNYGEGRSALEKTVNYVFFPFSFEKKILLAAGDFVLQGPGRNLLINEGLRRYHESKYSTQVQNFLADHLPLFSQLDQFNAFSHGLSPGEFFLTGQSNNRTIEGKAANVLAAFFAPAGGAGAKLYKTAGSAADLTIQAFVPVVVTGESISRIGGSLTGGTGFGSQLFDLKTGIISQYIPMVRDLNEFFSHAADQFTALTSPSHEGQWAQYRDYTDAVDAAKAAIEPIATAFGHSSVTGFLASSIGQAFVPAYKQAIAEAQAKYPNGFQITSKSTDFGSLEAKAFQDLANMPNPSNAEAEILKLYEMSQSFSQLSTLGLPSNIVQSLEGTSIRNAAMKYAGDSRFVELWNKLFLYRFGPISRVAGPGGQGRYS
jgi:hypothetical protein